MAEARFARSGDNVTSLSPDGHRLHLRMMEAVLFASVDPLSEAEIAARLPEHLDVSRLLLELQGTYAGRGVNLRSTGGRWAFRTAEDLAFLLNREMADERKLSRAALETLAIIAYHQPVTRAEIEDSRGVAISKGTLDVLLQAGWVGLGARRETPGRPVTFGTTPEFLDHFGLASLADLPGLGDLKAAGLLEPVEASGERPRASAGDLTEDDADTAAGDFASLDKDWETDDEAGPPA
jgi:segregation and condensation protein B